MDFFVRSCSNFTYLTLMIILNKMIINDLSHTFYRSSYVYQLRPPSLFFSPIKELRSLISYKLHHFAV